MKRIITLLTAIMVIISALLLVSFASAAKVSESEEGYVLDTTYRFYSSAGVEETPGAEGAEWGLFNYWTGYRGTQIYDTHGEGMYVETTINCSAFKLCIGNGGGNGHSNVEVYVDGEKIDALDSTTYADGSPWQKDYTVKAGKHTIKILAGTPAKEGWNGFTFNNIAYIPTSGIPSEKADVTFYNSKGEAETPAAEGSEWIDFPHWKALNGDRIFDNHGSGMYVETAKISCDRFMVTFGNGGGNGHTNIEIYVDGEKIDALNATTHTDGKPWEATYTIDGGEHVIKVVAGTPTADGWNGITVAAVYYNAFDPAAPTSDAVISVLAVVCIAAAAAAAVKKH